jgi:hypothetical protein
VRHTDRHLTGRQAACVQIGETLAYRAPFEHGQVREPVARCHAIEVRSGSVEHLRPVARLACGVAQHACERAPLPLGLLGVGEELLAQQILEHALSGERRLDPPARLLGQLARESPGPDTRVVHRHLRHGRRHLGP